jgi:hypothetical protein
MSQQEPSATPKRPHRELRGRAPEKPAAGPALLSCLTTGLAGLTLFVFPGYYLYLVQCNERCDRDGWTGTRDAWEWGAAFWWLAVPGVLFALAVPILLAARRTTLAAISLTVSGLLYAGWDAWYEIAAHRFDLFANPWGCVPYAVMILGGASAIRAQRHPTAVTTP